MLDQDALGRDPRDGNAETVAQMTVLKDGSVSSVRIVWGEGRVNNDKVMEWIKKWTFKPAMCGSEPIVADIYFSIRFETPFIR